jgi:hypothetical protein
MLTAQVCSVITKQDPYMLAEDCADADAEDLKEATLHKFWKSAGFEQKIRRASHIATDTNKAWMRICWERTGDRPFTGLIWDVVHPRHTVIFPATVEGIQGSRLVGHRFYRRVREIEAMQRSGVYFEDGVPLIGGDTPQEYDRGGEIQSSGAAPAVAGPDVKDERVELWDCCLRYDAGDGEQWFRATFAFKTCCLLSFESYPYSRPWYFDAAYVTSNDDAYWSPVSVARHLSGLQDVCNKYNGALYNGSMMSAFPPIFGPELTEKDFRYTFGDYIPTDTAAQNWAPTITFRGNDIVRHLEIIDTAGDRAARISSNAQGTQSVREATATESSIIAADVSVGIEEYIANFAGSLGEIAEFTMELLTIHFSDWKQDAVSIGITQAQVALPCLWEPNGKSPGNTPGAKLAACEKLAQLAGQFGPATGIDIYELTRVIIANSGLFGADNIQGPKRPPGSSAASAGTPVNPGSLPPPGMAGVPALPPGSVQNRPGPVPHP